MRKTAFATLLLLLCTTWALAQSYPDQKDDSSKSGKASVQGCLSRSDSGFTLTDKSGTTYQLTGDTSQLSAHVGHEVQIKGTKADAASATASSSASGQSAQQQLQISGMKHISETCSSAPKSDKSSDKSSEKPMSEKPPTPR